MHNSPNVRSAHRGAAARLVVLRVHGLDAIAPLDAAEAFRDLPGLALLESARPGRTGRWSYLTADPVAVVDAPSDGADPFAEARAMLARLTGGPARSEDHAGIEPAAPPFAGGLVGYLGYDLGRRFERLPSIARVDQHLPALRLALHDWALAWDRRTGRPGWRRGRSMGTSGGSSRGSRRCASASTPWPAARSRRRPRPVRRARSPR